MTTTKPQEPSQKVRSQPDYILVVDKRTLRGSISPYIVEFLKYLQEHGVEMDVDKRPAFENLLFIKVRIKGDALEHYANLFNVDIYNDGHTYIPDYYKKWKLFSTALTYKNLDLFRRQGTATSAEKILILNKVFETTGFGLNLCGLSKLIKLGLIKTAYPLHDGKNDSDGSENDRQTLRENWSSFRLWYKEQPLNLIEKYYGTEIAFYFAWLGFYNFMLVPAALVGTLVFLINIIRLTATDLNRVGEICNSDMIMCPICNRLKECVFRKLSESCFYSKLSFLFDNYMTVFFAVFMSFWATVFLNLWTRRENILKLRWNVEVVDMSTKFRPEFEERAKHKKFSIISNVLEPYVRTKDKIRYYTLTIVICTCLVLVVLLAVFSTIMYRISLRGVMKVSQFHFVRKNITFFTMVTGSILQVIFIKVFGQYYGKISFWLTTLENPRTQLEFDNSMLYKRFALGFFNNYASLFYIAFLKGRLYTKPSHQGVITSFESDVCHVSGCITALCIQLAFIVVLKSLIGNIITLLDIPKNLWRRCKKMRHSEDLPQWAEEYHLSPTGRYLLVNEYLPMILQFGLVTFFVTAFPLAPLCALINNIIELRLDAFKFTNRYRRPVPRKASGIGAYNGLLLGLTYLSTAVNAFVLAFTSDFVARQIYHNNVDVSLKGFINSTLSVFSILDYDNTKMLRHNDDNFPNFTVCYYRGNRYPPDHPKQYQLTDSYWHELGFRLLCVIVFEHVILIFNGILSYAIQDIPTAVKEQLNHQRRLQKEAKVQILTDEFNRSRGKKVI